MPNFGEAGKMLGVNLRLLGVLLAGSVAFWSHAGALQAQVIGSTTEARNEVTGELGTVVRSLSTGASVSAREIVRTGPASATALRFLDGTNLNVGAVSTVVLDRFVFDPNGVDDVVINLTKGALRFVSAGTGPRNATITTPGALIGIRGTDLIILCDSASDCAANIDKGRARICPVRSDVPFSLEQMRRACLAGDEKNLPCGYYEIAGVDEQASEEEGNFTHFKPNCVVSGPQDLPRGTFRSLQTQLANGLPWARPTQLASLVSGGGTVGFAALGIGTALALGTGAVFLIVNDDGDGNPVTP